MKIFVTGATGFIGRAFCRAAVDRGHRLLALCRSADATLPSEVEIAHGTMADTSWPQVENFAPDAVLHLAWIATPGTYLTSPQNGAWLEWSKAWFRRLHGMGVPHIAGTGTCIEYAPLQGLLNETTSPRNPAFPYSRAKAALFDWLGDSESFRPESWSWFRVFYPYGPGEHPDRISSSLIRQLHAGQRVELRTPHSVKDYIFIEDVASAICQAIESKLPGPINVGTGEGISIEELAGRIARLLHADAGLVRHAPELSNDPSPVTVADSGRLRNIGWSPRVGLDAGLQRLVDSLLATP